MDDCRFDLFIDFLRQKIENFQHDDMDELTREFSDGMRQALVDAEIIRDATPEWLSEAEVS